MWNSIIKRLQQTDSLISLGLGLAIILVAGSMVRGLWSKSIQEQKPESQQTQEGVQVPLPLTHTVVAGETLWAIAEKYYKSGYNWVDIARDNKLALPGVIEKGQALTIPQEPPMPTTLASAPGDILATSTAQPAEARTYTVVRGDTLWAIAVKQYNDGYKWGEIARANKLVNPDLIHAGNVLQLP